MLGIVGYGHIGSQLSVLAESMGMKVVFYDILPVMPLGTACPVGSLEHLLCVADFVSIHVPETPETISMITDDKLRLMKKGSYLINASRGSVVDLGALSVHLKSGSVAGAALDVFPVEPHGNGEFIVGIEKCANVILTPHIGGSTEEAQEAIGQEVASSMIRYIEQGSSIGAVNIPELDLRATTFDGLPVCRVLNIHKNVPGVLNKINQILSEFNIDKQICDSRGSQSYMMADVSVKSEMDLDRIFESIFRIPESIATRIVY